MYDEKVEYLNDSCDNLYYCISPYPTEIYLEKLIDKIARRSEKDKLQFIRNRIKDLSHFRGMST